VTSLFLRFLEADGAQLTELRIERRQLASVEVPFVLENVPLP
jgi:hypothetical protein